MSIADHVVSAAAGLMLGGAIAFAVFAADRLAGHDLPALTSEQVIAAFERCDRLGLRPRWTVSPGGELTGYTCASAP